MHVHARRPYSQEFSGRCDLVASFYRVTAMSAFDIRSHDHAYGHRNREANAYQEPLIAQHAFPMKKIKAHQ